MILTRPIACVPIELLKHCDRGTQTARRRDQKIDTPGIWGGQCTSAKVVDTCRANLVLTQPLNSKAGYPNLIDESNKSHFMLLDACKYQKIQYPRYPKFGIYVPQRLDTRGDACGPHFLHSLTRVHYVFREKFTKKGRNCAISHHHSHHDYRGEA